VVSANIFAAILRSLGNLLAQSADSFAGIRAAVMRAMTATRAMTSTPAMFARVISTGDIRWRACATVPRIDGRRCGGIGYIRVGSAGAGRCVRIGIGSWIDWCARIAAGVVRVVRLVLPGIGQVFCKRFSRLGGAFGLARGNLAHDFVGLLRARVADDPHRGIHVVTSADGRLLRECGRDTHRERCGK